MIIEEIALQLERWADESLAGGWSTHQVEPMRRLAARLRAEDDRGYVVWHRLNGDLVRLPIPEKVDRANPVVQVLVYDTARDASLRPWEEEAHTGAPGNSRAIRADEEAPSE